MYKSLGLGVGVYETERHQLENAIDHEMETRSGHIGAEVPSTRFSAPYNPKNH